MIIGLCYDLQNTYDISNNSVYKDFSFLSEVEYVERSLRKLGHKVVLINGLEKFVNNIQRYKSQCDLIFNMLEGYKSRNREGLIPALCEAFDIAYTGTDAFGMSLSLNKYHMCQVVKSLNIKVANSYLIDYPTIDVDGLVQSNIRYPCVIKPNREGSSMGVMLVYSQQELIEKAYNLSTLYDQQLIVEEYIPGTELSVGILGTSTESRVYTCLEFVNEDGSNIELFDYHCKYNTEFKAITPRLKPGVLNCICDYSLIIHKTIGFQDISRIDWRVNNSVPYFIEATPLPAFDIGSDFDIGSKMVGENFESVLNKVLLSALKRKKGK